MQRVLFIASSGGHYKQLRKLDPLIGKYHGIVITERIRTLEKEKGVRYLHQVNRKEKLFPFWLFVNAVHSFLIFLAVRPDVIVTTGVLCTIPLPLTERIDGSFSAATTAIGENSAKQHISAVAKNLVRISIVSFFT